MGIGDWLSSAWKKTKNAVSKAVTTVKDAVKWVAEKGKDAASAAVKVAGQAITAVHDDIKGVAGFVGSQVDKYTTAGTSLIGGLGSAISSPLTWIALAIGGAVLLPVVVSAAK